jgi:hypothetical protein
MSKIGNTVQCGVFMLDGTDYARQFPIPCTGTFSELGIPADRDDYYIVYPGFSVNAYDGGNFDGSLIIFVDNTNGTIPTLTSPTSLNRSASWRVYYMNEQIFGGSTGTSSIVSVNNNIGNSVQCGVYMIDQNNGDGRGLFPVPFTGNTDETGVPENKDDYYVVFPGFKVRVRKNADGTGDSSTYANTSGTMPAVFPAYYRDEGSYWQVFYMENEIFTGNSATSVGFTPITNNNIANTIQCGVFMIDLTEYTYPIPFTANRHTLHIKYNADDYYLVYPGFCVYAYSDDNYTNDLVIINNTDGTSPQIIASNNRKNSWKVYYMKYQIG